MDDQPFRFFDEPRISDPAKVSVEYQGCTPGNRPYFEDLWARFRPLCPDSEKGFLTTARDHFRGAVWQMHLTVLASKLPGFQKGESEGPDFFLHVGARRCAIECTALRLTDDYPSQLPRPGRLLEATTFWDNEDHRIARIGDGLCEKRKARDQYVSGGIVRADEHFVIAVSLGELYDLELSDELPQVVRATYGIGGLTLTIPIDTATGKAVSEGNASYPPQRAIRRSPQKNLRPNDFFTGKESDGISGVLYSGRYCAPITGEDGRELIYVHNVFAENPLPFGTFPWGREYGPTGSC